MASLELITTLSNAAGTPGHEDAVRAIVRQQLAGITEFSYDRLGSIIATRRGSASSPKIMLAAHMDEVGLMVRYITSDGFVKFHPLGFWWNHVLLAQPMLIKTRLGDVPGIIGAKPIHHLSPEERQKLLELKDMFLDVGASTKQQAMEEFGVQPGDHIVPATMCVPLRNPGFLSGKAFDDRVGVALMIEALQSLVNETHPNTIVGVGTVQEEVQSRGAETASDVVNPDVAIVLEGSPADDFPGANKDEAQGIVGLGPQIRAFDPTMIAPRILLQFVLDVAQSCQIPHQIAVRVSGGTDGQHLHVHANGVPTIVLGVPVRYAHSPVGIISLDDYAHTLQLLSELLRRLDATNVTALTTF
jgi:putative aminopeptidase FrvX